MGRGNFQAARGSFNRGVATFESVYGINSLSTANMRTWLATLHSAMGDFLSSKEILDANLPIIEQGRGRGSIAFAANALELAEAEFELGNLAACKILLDQIESVLDGDSFRFRVVQNLRASLLAKNDERQAAASLFMQSLDGVESMDGADTFMIERMRARAADK
jgi:hypothetical protein